MVCAHNDKAYRSGGFLVSVLIGMLSGSFLVLGCATPTKPAEHPKPEAESAAATATATTDASSEPPAPPSEAEPRASETGASGAPTTSERLPVDAPLAPEVNAGSFSRPMLNAVLQLGIGRFLSYVRIEPAMVRGRFAGWRILSLFAQQPEIQVAVLRPGDTVLRANGQSIERPEEFKVVWDSLATAHELVLDIERAGRPSKLRYVITD